MSMLETGAVAGPGRTGWRGSRLRIWSNTLSATVLVGSELAAIVGAFVWALAGLLALSAPFLIAAESLALALSAAVMLAFARRAYASECELAE